ncbi:MAG: hypothetical protein ABIB97_03555 [Patescibacteria group bacterium]
MDPSVSLSNFVGGMALAAATIICLGLGQLIVEKTKGEYYHGYLLTTAMALALASWILIISLNPHNNLGVHILGLAASTLGITLMVARMIRMVRVAVARFNWQDSCLSDNAGSQYHQQIFQQACERVVDSHWMSVSAVFSLAVAVICWL